MNGLTQAQLWTLGLRGAAIALIFGTLLLFLSGGSGSLGGSFRTLLEPPLRSIRDRTSLSRLELADRTIFAAIALAVASVLVDHHLLGMIIAPGLWISRPRIQRLTVVENRMLAHSGYFSIDLVIGLYTPVMLAQFLLANFLLGACLFGVVVALSWPAGGGSSIPGRRWQVAPVPS